MMEAYDLDMGMVTRPFKSAQIISTPVMTEKMVMISDPDSSDYGDPIHPRELEVINEIHLDWGANYQLWHDLWWPPSEHMNYFIDTPALINRFIGRHQAWAVVPLSIARTLEGEGSIKISSCSEPIPDRVIYKLTNRQPKPGSQKALAIFERELQNFIEFTARLEHITPMV